MTEQQRHRTVTGIILIASALLVLIVVVLYSALSSKVKYQENKYKLYYVSKSADRTSLIGCETKIVLGEDGAAPSAEQLLASLLDGPSSAGLLSPFPSDVQIKSVSFNDGVLYVDLNGRYAELDAYERSLADCCLFLTASGLDGVYALSISADGIPLCGDTPLTRRNFITDDSFFYSYEAKLRLYYPSEDFSELCSYRYPVTLYEDFSAAETVVYLLTERVFPLLPHSPLPVELFHSVKISSDIAYVDLSSALLIQGKAAPPADSETDDELSPEEHAGEMFLHAIVYSLTELGDINDVMFSFDGQTVERYADLDLSRPIQRYDTVPVL